MSKRRKKKREKRPPTQFERVGRSQLPRYLPLDGARGPFFNLTQKAVENANANANAGKKKEKKKHFAALFKIGPSPCGGSTRPVVPRGLGRCPAISSRPEAVLCGEFSADDEGQDSHAWGENTGHPGPPISRIDGRQTGGSELPKRGWRGRAGPAPLALVWHPGPPPCQLASRRAAKRLSSRKGRLPRAGPAPWGQGERPLVRTSCWLSWPCVEWPRQLQACNTRALLD